MIRPMPPPNGTVHTLPRLACQLAVMMGASEMYQPFCRLKLTKYWSSIWFTAGLSECPAKFQTSFATAPIVQCPGCTRATTDGPALHLPWPRTLLVAVGRRKAGPMPQISLPGLTGERKKVGLMSPRPITPRFVWGTAGWFLRGALTRVIKFHLSLTRTGVTA